MPLNPERRIRAAQHLSRRMKHRDLAEQIGALPQLVAISKIEVAYSEQALAAPPRQTSQGARSQKPVAEKKPRLRDTHPNYKRRPDVLQHCSRGVENVTVARGEPRLDEIVV